MFGRRAAFWAAVGLFGGVVAPFAFNLAADKLAGPLPGLARLRDYVYQRPGAC